MPAILLKPESLGSVMEPESHSESLAGSLSFPLLWEEAAVYGRGLGSLCGCGLGPVWAWLEQPVAPELIPMSSFSQLPFEKNCGADHICQDDLGIIFGFSE